MNVKNIVIVVLAGALIVAMSYLFRQNSTIRTLAGSNQGTASPLAAAAAQTGASTGSTVEIQPASDVLKAVSASGNIDLVNQIDVASEVGSEVSQVNVHAGDTVRAGQVLVDLNTADLERALALAQLAVQTDKNQIDLLKQPPTPENVATARANLASAQTALANLKAGPTQQQLDAARSALTAAEASYTDLIAAPDQNKLTQLSADLKTKEVAVQQAQTAYDKIAWSNEAGMTPEAAALQQATIAYEAAKAAYAQATEPPTSAQVQSAQSAIQSAKETLAALTPTDTAIANAEAQVVSAQSALDTLTKGPDAPTLKNAELTLQQALVNLEQAQSNLTQAQIRSPISGTVLAINPTVGQQVTPGEIVATLADPSQLQLTVDVAEVDIPRLHVGQQAQIAIDAFAGQTFRGEVSQIAPVSDSTTGVINYPVTIRLTGDNLAAVRPGMTAVATISGTNPAATDEWFVPTNSIQRQGGAPSVTAMRNGAALSIPITPTNQVQGDWTLVNAAGLQSGDQVVGSVTTKITSNPFQFGGGGGPGGGRQGRPAP